MKALISLAIAFAAAFVPFEANAQTCNNSTVCVSVVQNGSGNGLVSYVPGTGIAIDAEATSGDGVDASSTSGNGVTASSVDNYGVYASGGTSGVEASGGSFGVHAQSTSGYGVYATTTSGMGVWAESGSNYGVWAQTTSGNAAVYASNSNTGSTTAAVLGAGETGGSFTGVLTGVYGTCSGTGCYAAYFQGRTDTTGCIQYNGTNEFGCSSDRRLKKNIEPLGNALDTILRLKGVNYDWKKPEEQGKHAAERQTGFIAQDVEEVFPNWVDEDKDGNKTLMIQPNHIAALEVEAIRTLKLENDELRQRVKSLETGRRVVAGFDLNGIGFAVGGLALAAAMVIARRKRAEEQA